MKNKIALILLFAICGAIGCLSCSSDNSNDTTEPMLIVKFKFDENQTRLNNIGQPTGVTTGNAAQSPRFNTISSHYFELAPTATTQLGDGVILYHAPETNMGGSNAIDFSQAKIVSENEVFLKVPLRLLNAGSYSWARLSLSYQNYNIDIRHNNADFTGTLASFVGFNTYVGSHSIGNNFFDVNGNRPQGYWAFALNGFPYSTQGQAPAGATTVPNPIAATSPIPAGSCVVTGQFENNLVITGEETDDIVITLSLSVNNSFEWMEVNADGKFEPSIGESVIDMGIRGLVPSFSSQN